MVLQEWGVYVADAVLVAIMIVVVVLVVVLFVVTEAVWSSAHTVAAIGMVGRVGLVLFWDCR